MFSVVPYTNYTDFINIFALEIIIFVADGKRSLLIIKLQKSQPGFSPTSRPVLQLIQPPLEWHFPQVKQPG